MDWFYEKNGQQQGPVSEFSLKELFENGTIGSNNLVWKQGMSDWATYGSVFAEAIEHSEATTSCPTCGRMVPSSELIPAGDSQVCPHCRDEFAQGLREGLSTPVRSQRSRGTGGMTPNSEIRSMARDTLAGSWGSAVLVMFLFGLLQQAGAFIPFVGPIVQWLIVGPLMLGFFAFFIGLHRGEPVEVGTLFSGFSTFGRGLGIYFVTTIIISGVILLAAAPGIVLITMAFTTGEYEIPEESPFFVGGIFLAIIPATIASFYMYLRYAFVYLIANDNPDIGILESIRRSTQLVKGHKGKLFLLWLSFIGWHILGVMALFIGLLWSMTYMFAATVAFYEDLDEG